MRLIRKLSLEYWMKELGTAALGSTCSETDAFEAGFRAARSMAAQLIGKEFPYPDVKGLRLPLLISDLGEHEEDPIIIPPSDLL